MLFFSTRLKKFVFIFFALFVLVLTIKLGYYFYLKNFKASSQSELLLPPVPVPSDDERTPARKTGESWWRRGNEWVKMYGSIDEIGRIVVDRYNTGVWFVLGMIVEADKHANTIEVEFAKENCISDLSNFKLNVRNVSPGEKNIEEKAETIPTLSENTRLCGKANFFVEKVEIRWRVWDRATHPDLKRGSVADLEPGDIVWVEANIEDFIKFEGIAIRVLATQ